ncbi:hypothetical protein M404DRAFT_992201 [Pisolithus tinctorius Marx 270]|uniref:Uncharacterized protein n=1 Tax=Pisolithus tinctorius Marx 270 TaxID=870435 RepID=A0A0C3PIK2_PISTI|nr:hypothetical protein M404DRAFT_992201 [Pisolithus tinctorius Marx 270]
MSSGQELFMSIGVSLTRTPDISFEEQRIQDYLQAYIATNRPPAPCPQVPAAPTARSAMGLPPLFVPVAVPTTYDTSATRLPADLPAIHAFEPFKSVDESFQCISAQPLYSHFSHEVGNNARLLIIPSPPPRIWGRNICIQFYHTP